jgi:hypothetical protein
MEEHLLEMMTMKLDMSLGFVFVFVLVVLGVELRAFHQTL